MSFFCLVLGHKWQGCRCKRCGFERDDHHFFEPVEGKCKQVCSLCAKTETLPCKWHHCACIRCGKTRDIQHDWIHTTECEQVCRVCGKERAKHDYQPMERGVDRCTRCLKLHKLSAEEISERDEAWGASFSEDEEYREEDRQD